MAHQHTPESTTGPFPFAGSVCTGAHNENRVAHGGTMEIDECACGYVRNVNSNAGQREEGPWTEPAPEPQFVISVGGGSVYNGRAFATFDAALREIGTIQGWPSPVASSDFAVDEKASAVCIYETEEECNADIDGAYAPRITAPSSVYLG